MTLKELMDSGQGFQFVGSSGRPKSAFGKVGAGLPSGVTRPEQKPRRPGQPKNRVTRKNASLGAPRKPDRHGGPYPPIPLWQRFLVALWFLLLTVLWLYHVAHGILAAHR